MRITGKDYDFLIKCTDTVPTLKVSLGPGEVRHCGKVVFTADRAKEIVAFCAGMLCLYEHFNKGT
jgi:hypothetical protein